MRKANRVLSVLIVLLALAGGCRPAAAPPSEPTHAHTEEDEMPPLLPVALGAGERLRVVATTTIVADVAQNVGGREIDLTTLLPPGTDPHAFTSTPQDAATIANAHVVFANGVGLETFLDDLLESAGEDVAVVPVSYGVELLAFAGEHEHEHEGEAEGEHHHHGNADPHVWFDPHNVMVWVDNIEHTLSTLDPANAEIYQANAETYKAELETLDAWIREQVAQVPEGNRRLVTDHMAFNYFAHRYGFEQVGAVFPGYSTLAEPSAQELTALEDAIREQNVGTIFVGLTVNPSLAERVAEDTGTQIVFLYTGSLSEPDSPAGNYISFMEYDVNTIVTALRGYPSP